MQICKDLLIYDAWPLESLLALISLSLLLLLRFQPIVLLECFDYLFALLDIIVIPRLQAIAMHEVVLAPK